ncbi:brachyurin-like isoform X2 [Neocloeon triangulifer]|uniref:brachyurin-like isoform X2 n=1 Tax=Neocloeon triangulifer TaxID=2078957 RepID=UPI00286EE359|nr:brachyurin-like isoform X2 [Neocloeon triangulifer]XP_059491197.1 brachyurin-like isoform X2 [Neocloeon triangulifer]XP_059491199.1 brachyurin-like isoform X2 [Neocloeon triangulifer]
MENFHIPWPEKMVKSSALLIIIFTIGPTMAQFGGSPSSQNNAKLASYFEIKSTDNFTTVMKNVRTPAKLEIPAAEFDKIMISLKPRGDSNSMKGRNKEPDAGKVSMATNSEIDKGKPLDSGHFPWHAGINADGTHFCAGAMVSSRHIITVAHCVNDFENFTITLGDIDRNQFERNVILMTTDAKIVHSNYEPTTFANNIALLTMPIPIATNGNNIRPISLPKRSDAIKTFTKERAYLTGWGFTNDGKQANALLTRANVTVMEIGDCYKFFGTSVNFQHLCTLSQVNTCFANDGSPLAYRDSENTWSLIGLTHFRSDGNCESGDPLVFVRVTGLLAWLSEKTSLAVRN